MLRNFAPSVIVACGSPSMASSEIGVGVGREVGEVVDGRAERVLFTSGTPV